MAGPRLLLLEADGYRIVTDPYTGVPGYPPLSVSAHAVFAVMAILTIMPWIASRCCPTGQPLYRPGDRLIP